jgi:internalin A
MKPQEVEKLIIKAKQEGVTKLDLHNQHLKTLPDSICELTQLTELNLSCNQITALPKNIGRLTNLTMLDLEQNKLKALPGNIGKLTKLTVLNLYRNPLETLPENIGNLTRLTELNLGEHRGRLSRLPDRIGSIPITPKYRQSAKFNISRSESK